MKWTVLVVFAIGALTGMLLTSMDGKAQAEEKSELEREVEALNARLTELGKTFKKFEKSFDEQKTAFEHHSHPVKWWNMKDEQSTDWNGGVFFIAYPKVGKGEGDAAAAAAGGTWGTP